jgi:type I restriction enzyme, S subunit
MRVANWRKCKLGELLEIKHGYAFLGEHFADSGTHIVLTPGNFFDEGGFKHKGDKEKWYRGPIPSDYVLQEGDLIVAMTEQAEGLLGSSAIIPRSGLYLHNQRLGLVQLRDSAQTDKRFIYYVFNSKPVRQQIRGSASGTKIRHTAPSRISDVKVNMPSFPIQRRIAGILSAYDELIENSQRRIKILESMARALYREWFVHFRFPGHESVPRVPSPLGEIPKGWEGTMGDVASIDREGINPVDFPDEQFEHFSIPAYDDGRTPAVEAGEAIRSNKYCIDESCVLLSKLNPRIPRVWLPSPTSTRRAITSTEFLVLRPKKEFSREFIYAKCCSDDFAGHFASLAIGTSTSHQRVRPENVLAMPIAVPNQTAVERFTNHVAPMLSATEQLRATIQNLRRTRDILLPRLLSGQVELKEN